MQALEESRHRLASDASQADAGRNRAEASLRESQERVQAELEAARLRLEQDARRVEDARDAIAEATRRLEADAEAQRAEGEHWRITWERQARQG